jgi:hypothetical protein
MDPRGQNRPVFACSRGENHGENSAALHANARENPRGQAKSLKLLARELAERVGFEPTCPLRDKTLSRRPRYDHFGTSPLRTAANELTLDYIDSVALRARPVEPLFRNPPGNFPRSA